MELDVTVKRLQWMQAQLAELGRPVATAPAPVLITQAPRPAVTYTPRLAPPPPLPFPPGPASPPREPVFTVARVLAGVGVVVTLMGVAFLLVLAAQAGLLGPVVRVGLGTALAVGLLGTALWLHTRPGGRTGSAALAATGVAAAYLDTVAITGIYHWVHPTIGLTLSGVIALGGLGLAARWRSQWLGIALFAPIYVLAPPLADNSYLLAGFTLILAIASIGVQRPAAWPWLHVVRAVGTSGTLSILALAAGPADALPILGGAVLGATIGLLSAADSVARAGRSWPLVGAGVVSVVPVLLAVIGAPDWAAAVAALAVVASTVALGLLPGIVVAVRSVWFGVAAFAALIGAVVSVPEVWVAAIVLGLGSAALVAARREPSGVWAGAGLGGVGLLVALVRFGPTVTQVANAGRYGAGTASAIATAALALVFAVVLVWRMLPLLSDEQRSVAGIAGGVAALGAVTALLANIGWAAAGADGMRWGHGLATILWMATGAYLLLQRRHAGRISTLAGLVMIGAAVAKLFLFDLAALNGVARVIAFLLVGVTLLGVGAVYAARSDRSRAEGRGPSAESERTHP